MKDYFLYATAGDFTILYFLVILVSFLAVIYMGSYMDDEDISDWNSDCWENLTVLSIAWPIGVPFTICCCIHEWWTKNNYSLTMKVRFPRIKLPTYTYKPSKLEVEKEKWNELQTDYIQKICSLEGTLDKSVNANDKLTIEVAELSNALKKYEDIEKSSEIQKGQFGSIIRAATIADRG